MNWPWKKIDKKPKKEIELIEQYMVTLRSSFQQVKIKNSSASPEIIEKIKKLLEVETWNNAYEIERLLVEIYDEKTLDVEVDRRLLEAQTNLSENVSSHYSKKVNEIPQVEDATMEEKRLSIAEEKRAILNRIINDLQWNYVQKQTKREYARELTTKNGLMFIISTTIFILLIGIGNLFNLGGNLYYLAVALGSGLVGASFSMVVISKSRLAASSRDELKGLRRTIYVVTRSLIGLGAALILYFILQAGMLTGSIFPTFTPPELVKHKTNNVISDFIIFDIPDTSLKKIEFKKEESSFLKIAPNLITSGTLGAKDTLAVETKKFLARFTTFDKNELDTLTSNLTNKLWNLANFSPFLDFRNLALLIFWSIVAGFSEKFVPNLLAKAEEKVTIKSS